MQALIPANFADHLLLPDTPKTILVVDDQEALRCTAARHLATAGYAVMTAGTGADALRAAKRHPAAIILGAGLRDISGFDLCRALKRNPTTKAIPIVFVSASHTDRSDIEFGSDAGADAFLFHPVMRGHLLSVIAGSIVRAAAEAKP